MGVCELGNHLAGRNGQLGAIMLYVGFVPGAHERKRRWADYEEDEPLDPLPAGWLDATEEGVGAQKVPRTQASPLLSAGSCNRRLPGSDAPTRRGEGGCCSRLCIALHSLGVEEEKVR